jgi:hypothetical protein
MSLQAILAVRASRLEPRLRSIALVLATYEHPKTRDIFPGSKAIARDLGVTRRAATDSLRAILATQVVQRNGWRDRKRNYGLDYARLAAHQFMPKPSRPRAHNGTFVGRATTPGHEQPTAHVTARSDAATWAVYGQRHGQSVDSPILINEMNLEMKKNLPERAPVEDDSPVLVPGADAPVVPQPEPAERREERDDEEPERAPTDEPEPDPVFQSTPTFAVYRRLATDALQLACLERDDRPGNVAEHLKRLCATQSLPYDVAIIRKAVDVAFVLRQKRAAATWATAKAALGPAHRDIAKVVAEACAHTRRPRDLAGIG